MSVTEASQGTEIKKGRSYLQSKKDAREPIVMLTCYDYPTAVLEEQAGIDVVFVGDSVGTNVLGYGSETEVTMQDMVHHLRAVRRGVHRAYLLVDMPYQSYASPQLGLENARLFLQNGADGVKLEGGLDQVEVVRTLTRSGIDVCGHIGFTPQTLGSRGKVQGKSFDQARALIESALALQEAGAFMLVLELVTEGVARLISERLTIPTIGIGSGRYCNGQVLVVTDVLGLSPFVRRITKRYQQYDVLTLQALQRYCQDVVHGRFPAEDNVFHTNDADLTRLQEWLRHAESRPGR